MSNDLDITMDGVDALDAAVEVFRDKLFRRAERYAKERGATFINRNDVDASARYAVECEDAGAVQKALEEFAAGFGDVS